MKIYQGCSWILAVPLNVPPLATISMEPLKDGFEFEEAVWASILYWGKVQKFIFLEKTLSPGRWVQGLGPKL